VISGGVISIQDGLPIGGALDLDEGHPDFLGRGMDAGVSDPEMPHEPDGLARTVEIPGQIEVAAEEAALLARDGLKGRTPPARSRA